MAGAVVLGRCSPPLSAEPQHDLRRRVPADRAGTIAVLDKTDLWVSRSTPRYCSQGTISCCPEIKKIIICFQRIDRFIFLLFFFFWSILFLTISFFLSPVRFSVSHICPGLALCGALSIYTDKETVAILRPTCLINCADELPDTPLPDTVRRYHKVPVTDTAVTDLRPHMDTVANLIHQVIVNIFIFS